MSVNELGGGFPPLAYNIRAAAEVMGISQSNLRTLIREGILPAVRLRGRILLPREKLLEFLRQNTDSTGERAREIPEHIKKKMENAKKREPNG